MAGNVETAAEHVSDVANASENYEPHGSIQMCMHMQWMRHVSNPIALATLYAHGRHELMRLPP